MLDRPDIAGMQLCFWMSSCLVLLSWLSRSWIPLLNRCLARGLKAIAFLFRWRAEQVQLNFKMKHIIYWFMLLSKRLGYSLLLATLQNSFCFAEYHLAWLVKVKKECSCRAGLMPEHNMLSSLRWASANRQHGLCNPFRSSGCSDIQASNGGPTWIDLVGKTDRFCK